MTIRSFALLCAVGGLVIALQACTALGLSEDQHDVDITTTPGRIAFTFDDLPYVMPSRTSAANGVQQVSDIVAALAVFDVKATGFAVGQQINDESKQALNAFTSAGHSIGNHSWSHPDYNTLSPKDFLEETRRTDAALAPWLNEPKFYRFPFLREGRTAQSKAAAVETLARLGYRNAPVSIDTDDWRFNADYLKALDADDAVKANQIAQAYLSHIKELTSHFQKLAQETMGRDVDHILLLHLNQLNADHLGALLNWYATEGWEFVPLQEAMRDPIYAIPDGYVGPKGLSKLSKIALDRASR